MKKAKGIQAALEYHEKYGHIPKDYMQRLAWLYNEVGFTEKDLTELLDKIELLKETQWNELHYIFYMTPEPAPRPRLAPNTFVFYVSGAKMNKAIFTKFVEEHSEMECVLSTPTRFDTRVYIQTPKGMSKIEKVAAELELVCNLNEPDWDNLGKAYCDMVQEVLVSNDSIVYRGLVEKFYSVLPRIEVDVKFMTQYDCKYNKRTVEKRKSFLNNDKTLRDIGYII